MEDINIPGNEPSQKDGKENVSNFKFKKPRPLIMVIVALIILLAVGLYFAKGLFIAAIVNGMPISRLSVIKELEQQGGKQALQGIIDQKVIEAELNKQNVEVSPQEIDDQIKKIEEQVTSQGGTLNEALMQQGLTVEKLREQITIQEKLKKVLADKIAVSEADVDAYITESKASAPEGVSPEDFKKQISEQLKQQEFQQEAQKWITELTGSANIKYYVNYGK